MNKNNFNLIYYISVIITVLLSFNNLSAQKCPEYDRLMREGDSAFNQQNYEWAINRYSVAILHCQDKSEEIQDKIIEVFKKIEDVKNAAIKNEQKAATAEKAAREAQLNAEEQKRIALLEKEKAEVAEKKAKEAQARAEKQEQIAKSEKEKVELARDSTKKLSDELAVEKRRSRRILDAEKEALERFINTSCFHEGNKSDSLRILGGKEKFNRLYYGFMNRDGDFIIPPIYTYATMFDETGYAKVELNNNNYLLDISGKPYSVAYNIENLTSEIIALDLRNKQLTKFPPEILKHQQLKILLLSGNPFKNIPPKIYEKLDLITFDIDENLDALAKSHISAATNPRTTTFGIPRKARIVQMPVNYQTPAMNNTKGVEEKLSASGGRNDWVVSSNRDNNLLYDSPNGSPNGKTMGFMENFYVIGETETHLQLIKYDPTVSSTGGSRKVNMKNAMYFGWTPKDNLLLWRRAVVNPKDDFIIKGLVIHSAELLSKGIGGEQQLLLYNSPTLEKTSMNQNDIRLLEFLYIYDIKNGNYLVGVAPESPRSDVATKRVIKGWISSKNLQLWTNRLCLEPNSDPKAAAERRAKGVKATIFNSYQAADNLKLGRPAQYNKILWNDDKYEKGYPPSQKRMPVLGKVENNIYKTAVITDVYNKNNYSVLSADEHARFHAEYNTIRDKKQNINMVFVIDGTKSNHSFFTPIIGAIKSNLNSLEKSNKKYKIATFIYGKSGEGVLARQPLTTNHSAVIQALENYQNKQNLSQDNDAPTDMYEGINTALRTLDPKETNIIVLVGDAGNKLNVSNLNIAKKMKEKECGIIAFQTRNVSGRAGLTYDAFIDQTKKLIEVSSARNNLRPKLYEDDSNTYRLRYPVEATLPGSLTYSDRDDNMSQAELDEEIREMLKSFEDQHEAMLRDLDCKIYVDCTPGINEAVLEYILKEMPEIDIRRIRDMNYQLFAEGYAPIQVDRLEYPLFKFVLFLTDRELYDLETTLKKLVIGGSSSELRENIINAYKKILTVHYGNDTGNISDKTLAQATESVTGLPSKSGLLNKYTLKDLEDRRKVSDDEIRDISDYIEDKLLSMKRIVGNPDYYFRSRDNTYYWVPQDVIP